jgi:DNA-binding SARP family transcriptional activator
MPLSVRVLGGLQIERDGRPLQGFVSARARALLAYLAVTGQRHRREALADLLWGEWPETSARRSLRQVLFNLRQIIGPDLLITRDTVQLPHGPQLSLDLEPFLAQAHVLPGDLSQARLRASVALYHGDFLAGFDLDDAPAFAAWMIAQREALRALVVRALAALNAQAQARQDWAAAIAALERLLTLEPWREDIHRQLMRALETSS